MTDIPNKEVVRKHFDEIVNDYDKWKRKNSYYHETIKSFVRRQIRPGSSVLEVGCGTGDILAAVQPGQGMGIDISPEMVRLAQTKYPQYRFVCSAAEDFRCNEKFDFIVLVDVLDHVYDIMDVFSNLFHLCHSQTRIILTTINPWWEPVLSLAEKIGAKMPEGPHNFIEKREIACILELCHFTVNYSGYLLLFPKNIPLLSYLANTLGVRMWGLNKFSFVQYMIAGPSASKETDLGLGCSVIIPCRNEEENIENAIRRIPKMGTKTEIIVVNDGSTDKTADKVRALQNEFPDVRLIDYSPNRGKGHAVHLGFEAATEDVLMILDADLSVSPEELPRFFEPLNRAQCQFVNGTRMVYPMEKQAMRTLNLLGNKLFGLLMTFIIGQNLTDTLCGTKAFYRRDYEYFDKGMDRWGDFDLLFSAARMGLKILEVSVHYKERRSGESKMKTFRHAFHLLGVVFKGFQKVVFISGKMPRKN